MYPYNLDIINGNCPCNGCPLRTSRCHATCKHYKLWKDLQMDVKTELRKKQKDDEDANAYIENRQHTINVKLGRRKK